MTGTRSKPNDDEDLKSLILGNRTSMDDKFRKLNQKFDSMSQTVVVLQEENKNLKEELERLRDMINRREQHSRNSSLRINGFKLNPEAEKSSLLTSEAVCNQLFHPILQEAVKDKIIQTVPPMFQTIEFSHQLPAKKNGEIDTPKQILVRMQSRLLRSLVFKYKKKVLSDAKYQGIYLSDDLTVHNHRRLMEC